MRDRSAPPAMRPVRCRSIVVPWDSRFTRWLSTEAAMKFSQVSEISADDHAHQLYLKRAAHLLGNGAPPDWDGAESMPEK